MQKKSNNKIKDYNLEGNIDFVIPIDEIEINGMSIAISKLDDYRERVYDTNGSQRNVNTFYSSNNSDLVDNINLNNIDLSQYSNNLYNEQSLSHCDTSELLKNNDVVDTLELNNDKEESIKEVSTIVSEVAKNKKKEIKNKKVSNSNNSSQSEKNNDSNINKKDVKKKLNKKKRQKVTAAILVVSIATVGAVGYDIYTKYEAEQIRLSEFDKENLDLKLIIDTVDDCGGDKYQLNWQEVASILGVITKNRPEQITKHEIEKICDLFINKETDNIRTMWDIAIMLEFNNKEEERMRLYKYDLSSYGYMPERLEYNSPQMVFIESIKEGAIKSYKETGILPSITIAQAILESNWGQSNLSKESNNLFGIKADRSWKGEYVTFETKEYHSQMIKDKFRKYDSIEDSILDHSKFLAENKRYTEGGVFEAKTYKAQALALQESGYSTAEDENGNKTYASMLEKLIRQYNLQVIDADVRRYKK